jgi:hypothetical protein
MNRVSSLPDKTSIESLLTNIFAGTEVTKDVQQIVHGTYVIALYKRYLEELFLVANTHNFLDSLSQFLQTQTDSLSSAVQERLTQQMSKQQTLLLEQVLTSFVSELSAEDKKTISTNLSSLKEQ